MNPESENKNSKNLKNIQNLSKVKLLNLFGAHFPCGQGAQTHMFYKVEKCPRPQMPFPYTLAGVCMCVHHEGIGKIFVLYWRSMYGNHEKKSSLCLRVGDKI